MLESLTLVYSQDPTLNLFSRTSTRAASSVRVSVQTLPPLKFDPAGEFAYIVPRVRNLADGTVTHLDNASRRFERVWLTGALGSGTSTALQYLAAQASVPVVSFRDFHSQLLPTDFHGRGWILLDDASTAAMAAHVGALAKRYPQARIWAATNSPTPAPDGFTSLELQPFNEREILSYAEEWFPLPPAKPHTSRLNRAAQNFLASAQANAGTRELAITPLYLYLLMQVYVPAAKDAVAEPTAAQLATAALPMLGGNVATPFDVPQRTNIAPLPTHRADLFDAYLRGKLESESDPDFAARALEGIALSTKRGQRAQDDHLPRGYDFLEERANGRVEFKHPLIQDFLAARALRRNPDAAPLLEHLADATWREVILFYAGLGAADEVVEAAVNEDDLELAAGALASCASANAGQLEQVTKTLTTRAWEDNDGRAMTALGGLRSNLASDFFAAKLRDKNVETRLRAAQILGMLHTDRSLEYLLPQLRDPSPEVREQVIASLGQSRSERVVEPLLVALRGDPRVASSDTRLKIAAARALGEYGTDKAVPALIVDLQVSDPEVKEQAVRALNKIRSPFALKPLTDIAAKDMRPEARVAAAEVLKDMGGE